MNTSPFWLSGKFMALFALATLLSWSDRATTQTTQTNTSSLLIPLGSYLASFEMYRLFASEELNKLVVYSLHQDELEISLDCWKEGHDIGYQNPPGELTCNNEVTRQPVNAAQFMYSDLVPVGSYLSSCGYLLKTQETEDQTTRSFLYASCKKSSRGWRTQKFDVTDCTGNIQNKDGRLACARSGQEKPYRQRVVSGSYLNSGCILARTIYDEDQDTLYSVCAGFPRNLHNVSNCLKAENGGDIDFGIYNGDLKLECIPATNQRAEFIEASAMLPAGNYTATCRQIVYYPCMDAGNGQKGVLAAICQPNPDGQESRMTNTHHFCKIDELGYISNIGGQLVCDPDISFQSKDPLERERMQRALSCPE